VQAIVCVAMHGEIVISGGEDRKVHLTNLDGTTVAHLTTKGVPTKIVFSEHVLGPTSERMEVVIADQTEVTLANIHRLKAGKAVDVSVTLTVGTAADTIVDVFWCDTRTTVNT
jgi:hypothetical protein